MAYNPLVLLVVLILKLSPIWPVKAPSNWLWCHLTWPHDLDTLWHKIFLTHLVIFLTRCWTLPFFQGTMVSLEWRRVCRSQNPGPWRAHYHWMIDPCSQTLVVNRTREYVHTFIATFICLCLWLHQKARVSTDTSNFISTPQSSF